MNKIHLLPEKIINLIAAGEVVERPASALKELIENSIDAKATEIIIRIEESGTKLIEVKDNGKGMNEEDALLAFKLHATSKIYKEEDLQNIMTMGFRGEALASISSVAGEIVLETKTKEDPEVKLLVCKDKIEKIPSTYSDQGTKISIKNIFENIPARKKFLKSSSTELKYITNTFIELALVNKEIHFEIYHNNKLLYRLPKSETIQNRIFDIFGGEVLKNIYDPIEVISSYCKIQIIIGKPETSKKTSSFQYSFVNSRFIVSKVIQSAVQEAYKGFIHKELRPNYFILIHIDPSLVDVNIHPRKLEVKFLDGQQIFRLIYSSIRKKLENQTRDYIRDNLEFTEGIDLKTQNENADHTSNEANYSHTTNKDYSNSKVSDTQKYNASYKTYSKNDKIKDALTFTNLLLTPSDTRGSTISDQTPQRVNLNSEQLFQLFNTYILVDKGDKVVIIDQHAACEKSLFEKLVKEYGKVKSKPLLTSQIFEFKTSEKKQILEKKEALKSVGIVIDDFGQNSIQLSEIPEVTDKLNINDYFDQILDPDSELESEYQNYHEYNGVKLSKETFILLATTACHGSIRAGEILTFAMMKRIINELSQLDNPFNCPHGRPTMWEISKSDIEKNFKRRI